MTKVISLIGKIALFMRGWLILLKVLFNLWQKATLQPLDLQECQVPHLKALIFYIFKTLCNQGQRISLKPATSAWKVLSWLIKNGHLFSETILSTLKNSQTWRIFIKMHDCVVGLAGCIAWLCRLVHVEQKQETRKKVSCCWGTHTHTRSFSAVCGPCTPSCFHQMILMQLTTIPSLPTTPQRGMPYCALPSLTASFPPYCIM